MEQQKIEIRQVYTWYNVYINTTLILKNLSQKEISKILKTLHKTNTPYYLNLKNI